MNAKADSVRILPDDRLLPLPLETFFDAEQSLEVDVGCGKGRFLLAHAQKSPSTNYLGIDRMLRRIRKIDKKAIRRGLHNIRLLRMEAYYAVTYLIPDRSVSTYYIFFPDPWPKKRHQKNRLFNPLFIDALYRTLISHGVFHFATDHQPYFEQVMEILENDRRFNRVAPYIPSADERTDFELIFMEQTGIGRGSFQKRTSFHPGVHLHRKDGHDTPHTE